MREIKTASFPNYDWVENITPGGDFLMLFGSDPDYVPVFMNSPKVFPYAVKITPAQLEMDIERLKQLSSSAEEIRQGLLQKKALEVKVEDTEDTWRGFTSASRDTQNPTKEFSIPNPKNPLYKFPSK